MKKPEKFGSGGGRVSLRQKSDATWIMCVPSWEYKISWIQWSTLTFNWYDLMLFSLIIKNYHRFWGCNNRIITPRGWIEGETEGPQAPKLYPKSNTRGVIMRVYTRKIGDNLFIHNNAKVGMLRNQVHKLNFHCFLVKTGSKCSKIMFVLLFGNEKHKKTAKNQWKKFSGVIIGLLQF